MRERTYQYASEEEVENRRLAFLEDGGVDKPPLPYLDLRYTPPKWFGSPRPGELHPSCPNCGSRNVVLIYLPHVDADDVYHKGLFSCNGCDEDFRWPP